MSYASCTFTIKVDYHFEKFAFQNDNQLILYSKLITLDNKCCLSKLCCCAVMSSIYEPGSANKSAEVTREHLKDKLTDK